jgi:hypothetical protein
MGKIPLCLNTCFNLRGSELSKGTEDCTVSGPECFVVCLKTLSQYLSKQVEEEQDIAVRQARLEVSIS